MYNKSVIWYISQEIKKLAPKIESKINAKGSPTVKVKTKVLKESIEIIIDTKFYAKFQDKGVKGIESGKSISNYKFKKKMPPPKAFERYTSVESEQFAIARSVFKKGIPAKKYIDTVLGNYAPQISRAIDRGVNTYIEKSLEF